jgi:hypothetical protein
MRRSGPRQHSTPEHSKQHDETVQCASRILLQVPQSQPHALLLSITSQTLAMTFQNSLLLQSQSPISITISSHARKGSKTTAAPHPPQIGIPLHTRHLPRRQIAPSSLRLLGRPVTLVVEPVRSPRLAATTSIHRATWAVLHFRSRSLDAAICTRLPVERITQYRLICWS